MHKSLPVLAFLLAASGLTFLSCEKKNNSDAITPTFGTSGNPNPGYQTVTGTNTYTNPATENTSLYVGGGGWTNPTCGSTNSISLNAFNGTTNVILTFASPVKSGTYAVMPVQSGTASCVLTIQNAPQQPAGIVWIGKSGQVAINTTSTSINATFNNIVCTQQNFSFPSVVVSGVMGCSQ